MRTLILSLRYLFSINPERIAHYGDTDMLALLALSLVFVVGSFVISFWRKRLQNSMTRKLTSSWSSMTFWMGIVGLVLVVARVERIQVIAMPLLWVVWGLVLLAYAFVQWRMFSSRHYEVMPRDMVIDPNERYLPKRKK